MLELFSDPRGHPGGEVLCYDAVQDVVEPGALAPFIMPPTDFERQIDAILADGWHFIDGSQYAAAHLRGEPLPPRSVLLTFDDGFDDLESIVAPMLTARNIPAIAFVVAQRLGETNSWDTHRGAPALRLHDVAALHRLTRLGFDIAPHSRTHALLLGADLAQLRSEIGGSKADLAEFGFPASPFLAYPFGSYSKLALQAVVEANIELAFTTARSGMLSRYHRLKLPRLMIERGQDPVAALNRK